MSVKLLIADDEDVIRNGITKYIKLHTERFDKIYMAKNGQEALELIFKHRPDIMLMDVHMPVKNGLEVMEEALKAHILPVTVILSGYDEFKYAQRAIKIGAKDYLLKPCRSSDILKCLLELTDELFGTQRDVQEEAVEGNQLVNGAVEYMKEHYNENLTLHQVAEKVGITAGYLSTLFSQNLHRGFVDYLNEIRVERASMYLQQNYLKTYEIAYRVGFNDEKYFSKVFKKIKGVSPAEYKKHAL